MAASVDAEWHLENSRVAAGCKEGAAAFRHVVVSAAAVVWPLVDVTAKAMIALQILGGCCSKL